MEASFQFGMYPDFLTLKSFAKMSKVIAAYKGEGKRERTPKGHFVIYVGENLKRFIVPMSVLKKPSFQQLLDKSAEMYEFQNQKGIVLPCDESTFQKFIELEEGK
ncbi:hypothetical protein ACH5RR_022446 [Cinchona calisaya]|uniref:Uncharacterized protein n=1 Tax=Cinchona calisaya TaxID=153742 RepID=A0ABD2Z9G4_9GENT